MTDKSQPEIEKLSSVFGFTFVDLDANRRRILTPRQMNMIRTGYRQAPAFALGMCALFGFMFSGYFVFEDTKVTNTVPLFAGVVVILAIVGSVLNAINESHTEKYFWYYAYGVLLIYFVGINRWKDERSVMWVLTFGFGGVILGLIVYPLIRLYHHHRFEQDLQQGRLMRASGIIRLDVIPGRYASNYRVHVQNQGEEVRFDVDKDQFLALKNNLPYHIYYLPSSKRVMSIEHIEDEYLRMPY